MTITDPHWTYSIYFQVSLKLGKGQFPVADALPNAAQDAAGFLCCKGVFLGDIQLCVHKELQVLLFNGMQSLT